MTAITLFIVVAFIGTVALLFGGGISMIIGGKFDLDHDIEFMQGHLNFSLGNPNPTQAIILR